MSLGFISRRTSTFFAAVCVTAFFGERGLELGADAIFNAVNKGVSIPMVWPASRSSLLHNNRYQMPVVSCRNCGITSRTTTRNRSQSGFIIKKTNYLMFPAMLLTTL